jgi:hypothetical protein
MYLVLRSNGQSLAFGNCGSGRYFDGSSCAIVPSFYYNPFSNSSVYYYCSYAQLSGAAVCNQSVGSCPLGSYYDAFTSTCSQAPAGHLKFWFVNVLEPKFCDSILSISFQNFFSDFSGFYSPFVGVGVYYYCQYSLHAGAILCALSQGSCDPGFYYNETCQLTPAGTIKYILKA